MAQYTATTLATALGSLDGTEKIYASLTKERSELIALDSLSEDATGKVVLYASVDNVQDTQGAAVGS
jgi:hypothetical protein